MPPTFEKASRADLPSPTSSGTRWRSCSRPASSGGRRGRRSNRRSCSPSTTAAGRACEALRPEPHAAGHQRADGSAMIELNETHDPDLASWMESANAPDTDFPDPEPAVRRVPAERAASPFAVGVAIGDQILDIAAAQTARRVFRAGRSRRDGLRRAEAQCVHGAGRRGVVQRCGSRCRKPCAKRIAARGRCARAFVAQAAASTPCRRRSGTTPISTPRFITRARSASSVPAGQPAAAELPMGADRLSRTRLVDSRVTASSFRGPIGQTLPAGAKTPVFGPRSASTTSWSSAFSSAKANRAGGGRSRLPMPRRTVRSLPAERLVGTRHPGVGSTSRWVRSCQEFRQPPFRRGSYSARRSRPIARREPPCRRPAAPAVSRRAGGA